MSTSHCLGHEACPSCRRIGNDRSGNNLAIYSDGHKYCFKCGYLESASGIQKLQTRNNPSSQPTSNAIVLPSDVDEQLPQRALDWLKKYALTRQDITNNTLLWSEYYQRLIFPYLSPDGLLGWQGRYLGNQPDKAKWFSQGKLHEFMHVVGNKRSRVCVLTEDIISAIKVSHNTNVCASPLFGSHISLAKLLRYQKNFDKIIIWLDDDMKTKVVKYSQLANSIGLPVATVYTELDPKEYDDATIKELTNVFTPT
jgi:hypothetical protein